MTPEETDTCYKCWDDFPFRHKNCGGLIHQHFFEECHDGYIMEIYCDKCNERWYDTRDLLDGDNITS